MSEIWTLQERMDELAEQPDTAKNRKQIAELEMLMNVNKKTGKSDLELFMEGDYAHLGEQEMLRQVITVKDERIAALENSWIPVSEPPKEEKDYLTMNHWYGTHTPMVKMWNKRLDTFEGNGVVFLYMPIPKGPE